MNPVHSIPSCIHYDSVDVMLKALLLMESFCLLGTKCLDYAKADDIGHNGDYMPSLLIHSRANALFC